MSPLSRFRHQATTGQARWAVALRGVRRVVARIEARRQAGSITRRIATDYGSLIPTSPSAPVSASPGTDSLGARAPGLPPPRRG